MENDMTTDNNPVHEALLFYWGERCPDHDPDCAVCSAYALYDRMVSAANQSNPPQSDWRDPNSGCYCVVCLAPVRQDIFTLRQGCCPNHKPDDECTYM
jgi:hypothetical protein